MDVCRLCLDLVATQGEAKLLDGETRDMVQVVAPELNLEASKEPRACAECQRTLAHLFEFKSRVFEREGEVRSAVGPRCGQLSLKEALEGGAPAATNPGGGDGSTPAKAKDRVCRTCLTPIECESFTVLRPSEPDAYLSSMLDVCLVEVDLELTRDPVMCETCLEQLQRLHHFRSTCQDVEEKIVEFREGDGSAMDHVDLHAVLGAATPATPDVEMVTVKEEDEEGASSSGVVHRRGGRKRVRVEPVKAEPVKEEEEEDDESEEEDDEDEDMSEGEEDLDKALKQEELDIKSETGTSDSDNIFKEASSKCVYSTPKKSSFNCHKLQHIYSKHQVKDKDAEPFKGPYYVSHCKNIVKKHMKVHEIGQFDCDECPFKGRNQQELVKHKVHLHGYQPSYRCRHCSYVSHCKTLLQRHMTVHEEGRKDCRECSFKGKTQQELLKHQVELHGYQARFKCSHCSYVSHRKDIIEQHARIHEEGRFDCKECSFKGKTRQELFKHQVEVHRYEAPFKCSHCTYVSNYMTAFRKHTEVHKKGRFDCEKCPFKGISRQELVQHQVENHGYQLPFKCSKCDFRSYIKNVVRVHEKKAHKNTTVYNVFLFNC